MASTASTAMTTVWCRLVNHEMKLEERLGDSFPVDIHPKCTVGHFKEKIKDKSTPQLNHVAANQLMLWKLKEPPPLKGLEFNTLLSTIHLPAEGEDDSAKVELANVSDDISELNLSLGKKLHFLVQVPGECIASAYKTSSHAFSHS